MKLSEIAVRRPVTIAMGAAVVLLLGVLSITRLELDLLPNLRQPIIGIATVYPGADPRAVENQITTKVESAIATVAGLKSQESYSMENASLVIATFRWGVNPSDAVNDLSTALAPLAATLPADAMKPVVAKIDANLYSLLTLGITGNQSIPELTRIAEDQLKPVLESLPGVAKVSLVAGTRPEVTVLFNTETLRANNIPPYQLYTLLQQQNALIPAGPLEDKGVRYNVRVGNPLTSAEDVRNMVVGEKKTTGLEAGGFAALIPQVLLMRDVAQVVEGNSPQQAYARVNGQPAVLLQVYKHSGASSVSVSRNVANALDRLNAAAGPGAQVHLLADQSEFITSSLAGVRDAALLGSLLAIIVLFFFLRTWRSITVIAVSIPLSIIIALILMYAGKLSLNLISLGGLALGVGRLVDDSIVVLENIIRHRREGQDPAEAAEKGASEVALAISASTLTTVVVFLPLAYLHSTAGQWFRDMAITVTFALIASLAVAITIVPAAAAKFLGRIRHHQSVLTHKDSDDLSEEVVETGWIGRMQAGYLRMLTHVLRRPAFAWLLALLLMGGGIAAPRFMPLELLPSVTSGAINATLTLPAGSPSNITNRIAMQVEKKITSVPGVAMVWSQVGKESDDVVQLIQGGGNHVAGIHIILKPQKEREQPTRMIADEIRRRLAQVDLAGGKLEISTERMTDSLGAAYAAGATVQLQGNDLDVLEEQAAKVAAAMKSAGGFTQVTTSVDQRQPEMVYTVDRTKALLGSMTTSVVGIMLRGALSGLQATTIQSNGESIPVVLRPQQKEISSAAALSNLFIQGIPTGGAATPPAVRFGRVVNATKTLGPVTIQHVNRMRTIVVSAKLDGIDLSEAKRRANSIITDLHLPAGTTARIAGVHDTIDEAVNELAMVLVLAVLLVYMVMAAQFESFVYPFIIMVSVPLAIAGGLVSLWLCGQNIGVSAMMGLIILTGVATSNGIIMVDAANQARHAGAAIDQAIFIAARNRLRPILMTSLTTIIGLIPLAFGQGEGTELQRPLAIAFMGGMIFSTSLTLFLVPAAYRALSRRARVRARQHHQITG